MEPFAAARATESPTAEQRVDAPHQSAAPPVRENGSSAAVSEAEDSVLAQWQRALSANSQTPVSSAPPRPSRREQLAAAAELPFVRRAMELFDVPPNQLRYTPPEGDND